GRQKLLSIELEALTLGNAIRRPLGGGHRGSSNVLHGSFNAGAAAAAQPRAAAIRGFGTGAAVGLSVPRSLLSLIIADRGERRRGKLLQIALMWLAGSGSG